MYGEKLGGAVGGYCDAAANAVDGYCEVATDDKLSDGSEVAGGGGVVVGFTGNRCALGVV